MQAPHLSVGTEARYVCCADSLSWKAAVGPGSGRERGAAACGGHNGTAPQTLLGFLRPPQTQAQSSCAQCLAAPAAWAGAPHLQPGRARWSPHGRRRCHRWATRPPACRGGCGRRAAAAAGPSQVHRLPPEDPPRAWPAPTCPPRPVLPCPVSLPEVHHQALVIIHREDTRVLDGRQRVGNHTVDRARRGCTSGEPCSATGCARSAGPGRADLPA